MIHLSMVHWRNHIFYSMTRPFTTHALKWNIDSNDTFTTQIQKKSNSNYFGIYVLHSLFRLMLCGMEGALVNFLNWKNIWILWKFAENVTVSAKFKKNLSHTHIQCYWPWEYRKHLYGVVIVVQRDTFLLYVSWNLYFVAPFVRGKWSSICLGKGYKENG